jgi:hypothetical protein
MKLSFRCETDDGQVLEFTEADLVGPVNVSTPYDVEDITPDGATTIQRRLTTPHVTLDVTFPVDKPPRWVQR